MVRPRASLRAPQHAPIRFALLSTCNCFTVNIFASYYFLNLTVEASSPYDVRLWQAQGMCYEEIGRWVSFKWNTIGFLKSLS